MSNWRHRRGDTWPGHLWAITDPETGLPRDLTGWLFRVHFVAKPGAKPGWRLSTELDPGGLELVDGDGREVKTPQGTVTLSEAGFPWIVLATHVIPPLDVGEYLWDLESTDPTGWTQTYESGKITISPDYTRGL